MEPPDAQAHYTEKLIRLPNLALYLRPSSYAVDDKPPFDLPEIRVLAAARSLCTSIRRSSTAYFRRVAARLPTACFLFIEGNPASLTTSFRDRLREAFEREGLGFERFVRFLPRMSPGQFGGLSKRIDVHIDSYGWTLETSPSNCWDRIVRW